MEHPAWAQCLKPAWLGSRVMESQVKQDRVCKSTHYSAWPTAGTPYMLLELNLG